MTPHPRDDPRTPPPPPPPSSFRRVVYVVVIIRTRALANVASPNVASPNVASPRLVSSRSRSPRLVRSSPRLASRSRFPSVSSPPSSTRVYPADSRSRSAASLSPANAGAVSARAARFLD